MDHHTALVNSVSAQVRKFHDAGVPFRIYHGSTNSTRTVVRDLNTSVDISALNNVLCVDTKRKIASVQPNVPMDALVKATLAEGLIPQVVPEFPGITVGGGFSGSAGESSSFKYGFLDATIDMVQCVLGDGTIREVGPNGNAEEKELFMALAGTLGTMGVLTRLDIRLLEAKPYVRLTYQPVWTFQEAQDMIEISISPEAGNDFVDGIMYSKTKGAIVSGKMVSETGGGRITQYTRPSDEWCFIHTEEMIEGHNTKSYMEKRSTSPVVDFVPLTDYLFRYDRGAFWMGKLGCQHFCLPFTKMTRTLLDSLFHTREMYTALHASKMQEFHIVEDLAVPFRNMVPFLDYLEEDFEIYPLWLCPLQYQATGLEVKHLPKKELVMSVGVWGPYGKKHTSFKKANLALEAKVKDLKGVKWLYAQCFYSMEEFWDIYDREVYKRLRVKYSATALPDIYCKVKPVRKREPASFLEAFWEMIFSFWLVGGVYGLYSAWRKANFVLKK